MTREAAIYFDSFQWAASSPPRSPSLTPESKGVSCFRRLWLRGAIRTAHNMEQHIRQDIPSHSIPSLARHSGLKQVLPSSRSSWKVEDFATDDAGPLNLTESRAAHHVEGAAPRFCSEVVPGPPLHMCQQMRREIAVSALRFDAKAARYCFRHRLCPFLVSRPQYP